MLRGWVSSSSLCDLFCDGGRDASFDDFICSCCCCCFLWQQLAILNCLTDINTKNVIQCTKYFSSSVMGITYLKIRFFLLETLDTMESNPFQFAMQSAVKDEIILYQILDFNLHTQCYLRWIHCCSSHTCGPHSKYIRWSVCTVMWTVR